MKDKTLMHSSIIAAVIIAAVVGVSMVTGFPGANPVVSAAPASDSNPGDRAALTGNNTVDPAQYITVDPVVEKTTGDLLIVTGSTNLPAGTLLMVQAGNFGGDTRVSTGSGGVNRFSAPVDTSGLKPGTQTIMVSEMKGTIAKGDYGPGPLNGTATFMLQGAFLGSDTPVYPTVTGSDYILLDAISDKKVGDQFLITGTTRLPVGTNLLWQILPESGTPKTRIDMTAQTGIMGNNAVTRGSGTANRVSFAADLGSMVPGNYIVLVSEMKGDLSSGNTSTGDLTGSALFTLN